MVENKSITFFPDTPFWRWLLIGFLLLFAFGIRMIGLNILTFDSHPTRQYRSALLARAFYLESGQPIPDWQKKVIQAQQAEIELLEPPLFEILVAYFYRLTGGEAFWIPRLSSIIFWLSGGIAIFLIGLKLLSLDVAVLAAGFFLFVPFGITVSRSFQPDVLMIMLLVWALYLLLNYQNTSNWRDLFLAAIVGSLGTLVKPQGLFMLLAVAITLVGYENSRQRHHLIIFLGIVMLPSLLYYGYHFLQEQTLYNQAKSSFLPQLWFQIFYWQFWLKHIWRVIGFSALVAGMFGILMIPAGRQRNFVIAMWLGYMIFGLFYSYYIHTHDYYHLQFIPAVALPLGFLGATVLQQLILVNQDWLWYIIVGCILLFAMFLNTGLYLNTLLEPENSSLRIEVAKKIGAVVKHSTETLYLAPYYGAALKYHGEIAGNAWPTIGDMNAGRLWGEQALTASERLDQFLQNESPEYFIVTDMTEYEYQAELQTLLSTQYPVIERSEDFIIFDLRQHR